MLTDLVEAANARIDQHLPVTDTIMTRDEINAIMPSDRTNMDLLPASVTELRIIQIGDRIDMCPCAGTHVSNIGELGHVQFLVKGNPKEKEHNGSATHSTSQRRCELRQPVFFD